MEDFNSSAELGEFNKAFLEFQKLGLHVKKDASNPHFKSSYASLPNVLESCMPELAKNGFTVMQLPLGGVEVCRILNRITHVKSGQFMAWSFAIPLEKKNAQGVGATITYGRRFSLTSSLGLPETDDDGNNTTSTYTGSPSLGNHPESNAITHSQPWPATPPQANYKQDYPKKAYVPRPGKIISEKAQKLLFVKTKQSGFSQMEVSDYMREKWGIGSSSELDEVQLSALLKSLEDKDLHIDTILNPGYKPMGEDELPF